MLCQACLLKLLTYRNPSGDFLTGGETTTWNGLAARVHLLLLPSYALPSTPTYKLHSTWSN